MSEAAALSHADAQQSDVTARLCAYMAETLARPLPEEIAEKTRHHILDTMASAVSGSRLKPGIMAAHYVRSQGGAPEATLIGTNILTSAVNAALANAMMAHADESDDSHAGSRTHPGCAVVPSAWAMAERDGRSGSDLLRAVTLGYDICCRITKACGVHVEPRAHRSTHTLGGVWGAAAAAGALAGLDDRRFHYLVSFAAQQTSGVSCWQRDAEHIEKAFDFAGMPARNGVAAATMVSAGFTGVFDALSGPDNFFEALARDANPEALVDALGTRYEVMGTNIKRWCVGSPIIAALDGLVMLIGEHGLNSENVEAVTAEIPESGLRTVNDRQMPDVSIQHVLAVALLDRSFSFASAHDYERMRDPAVLEIRKRISVVGSPELSRMKPSRQAIVKVRMRDGAEVSTWVRAVKGTRDNPMTRAEVEDKAADLMGPVIGARKAGELIRQVRELESVPDIRALRDCLQCEG